MRAVRKAIFWVHLAAGLLAGLVILVMALTGVVMSYERQILEANTGVTVKQGGTVQGPEALLAAHKDARPAPTGLTYANDPAKPAVVQFGRGKSVYVDPYSGASLGEGNVRLKKFFAWNLSVHRWLSLEGANRNLCGNITGIANLVFLFLVVSGLWLWFPKRWTKNGLKAITRIQWRMKGRARDWNWHNVFGFWACVPLFLIVVTGAMMSYSWASNLIYLAVGETPPPPRGQGGPPGGGEGGGERAPRAEGAPAEGGMAAEGGERRRGPRPEGGSGEGGERRGPRAEGGMGERRGEGGQRGEGSAPRGPVSLAGLDAGLAAVKAANPDWNTIQVSLPRAGTAQFSVSGSHRGRPDLRKQLTVDLATAQITKSEGMENQSLGRRIRGWVRWVHTGEALGWVGQAISGLAAFSAVVLVYTGFALSWRRFFKKRRVIAAKEAV